MADSPGGVEVDRASVRVVPDTSKFVGELRAFLGRMRAELKLVLPVSLDLDGIREDLQLLKARVAATKMPAAEVPLKPGKADAFARQVRADLARLQRQIEMDLPLTASAEQIRRDVQGKIDAAEAALQVEVPVDVEDAAAFRLRVRALVGEVEAIAARARPVVEVETRIDKDRARRAMSDISTISGQVAIGAARASAALATLGPPILVAAAAAVAIAPAIAAAIPAAAGLAGMVGVLAVGFGGIGSTLQLAFDPERVDEYRESLAKLNPAARQVVQGIVALRAPFRALQDQIQGRLFAGVGEAIEDVGKKLIIGLGPSLAYVADQLNGVLRGVANFLAEASNIQALGQLLRGSVDAMAPLAGAARSFADALLQIGVAAAPGLKILSSALADAAEKFAAWITAGAKSGQLTRVISTAAGLTVKVIGALGGAFNKIFQFLYAIGPASVAIFGAVLDAVGGLFSALKRLTPIIAANKVLFSVLGGALLALVSPVAAVVAGVVAAIVAFQRFGPQIMAAIGPFVAQLQQAWTVIVAAFQTAVPLVQQAISYVVQSIAGLTPQIQAVIGAFRAFLGAVAPIVAQIVGVFVQQWPQIQATAKSVFDSVMSIVRSVLSIITTVVRTTAATITALWQSGFGRAILGITRGALGTTLSVVRGALQAIAGVFRAVSAVLRGDWSGAWAGMRQIVAGAKTAIVGTVKGLWTGIKGVFSGAATAFGRIGSDLVDGLKDGIRKAKDRVIQAAKDLANSLPGWVRKVLGISSPSKVMKKIGAQTALGLIRGLTGSVQQVKTAAARLADIVSSSGRKAAKRAVQAADDALLKNARARESVLRRIEATRKKLDDLRTQAADYAARAKASVIATGNVTGFGGSSGRVTLQMITDGLKKSVEQAKEYTKLVTKLRKLGLNKQAIDQLVQAGPQAGLHAARAIAEGGKDAVKKVNSLQSQLAAAGGSLGKVGADAMFKAGIDTAKGLLAGLKAQESALARQAKQLAQRIVREVKRALKIKSPSRVMHQLGAFTALGFADGLASVQRMVDRQMTGLTRAPRIPDEIGAAGTSASGRRPINFYGPVGAQASDLLRLIDTRERDAEAVEGLRLAAVG